MLAPDRPPAILILGGTGEAFALAALAVQRFGSSVRVISSLAGLTAARRPAGEVRIGPFGGAEGLAAYLRAENVCGVIDATHPFATAISANALTACAMANVPRLTLLRPMWEEHPDDRWTLAADMDDAARLLPGLGRRAFLTVGSKGLTAFSGLAGTWFLVRLLAPPAAPLPLPHHEVVIGGDDRALIARHHIDVLVTKASGGPATEQKIVAARETGVRVLMIQRPAPTPSPTVPTVQEALEAMSKWANTKAR